METLLCAFNDIAESEAQSFTVENTSLFAVKHDNQMYVYENSCPHLGISLEFQPNQFLDVEKRFIQCSNHNALFEIESGLCLSGPCQGKSLRKIPFVLHEQKILVTNVS
jgi:nitrite reductase/ring-hydroxylating ferredoxin subunit